MPLGERSGALARFEIWSHKACRFKSDPRRFMTDLRLQDVVNFTQMIGPKGRYGKAVCETCSTVHKCTLDEFDSVFAEKEHTYYVAKMRAWNCCHEDEEPLNGFPDKPKDLYGVEIGE